MNRPAALFVLAAFLPTGQSSAQRIYERGRDVVLEDAQGRVTSLGAGFNPVPISDHRFLITRGARMGYGDIGCNIPDARNRVVIYDADTKKESLLFDKPITLPFAPHTGICVYEHADLSPAEKTLYVVIPCYATAGCLAIIDLPAGSIKTVASAMDVFVVRGGTIAGDLLFMTRLDRKPTEDDPRVAGYAYVHAHADGSRVAVVSREDLVRVGGNAPAPMLRAWLHSIHGRVFANGEWIQ